MAPLLVTPVILGLKIITVSISANFCTYSTDIVGGDSRVTIKHLHWHIPCWEWVTLCCPSTVSMVVQMPSSIAITDRIELCCKRELFEVCLRVLVTLDMLKSHSTDNLSSILDGSHAISIVWVLALGNHIANGDSIGGCTRTVNECFEIASNFNRMVGCEFIQIKAYR